MAVNYDSLFKDIGEIIQGMNVMINDGSNDWLSQLDTGFTSISNEYDTNNFHLYYEVMKTDPKKVEKFAKQFDQAEKSAKKEDY